MSHVALQRVAVRMLFDPAFAAAVYAAPERALAEADVSAAERRWLVAADRRAWRTDPYRRARALAALLDEYAAATALARATAGVAALDAFFSSALFHACIQERGALVPAFGAFLEERAAAGALGDVRVVALAQLEAALARLRRVGRAGAGRAAAAPAPDALLRLSPHVELLALPEGTLALFEVLRAGGALPPPAAAPPSLAGAAPEVAGAPPSAPAPPAGPPRESLLLEAHDGEVAIEHAPPALAGLLAAARAPVSRATLAAEAVRQGAEPAGAGAVLDDLLAQRLLVLQQS